MMKPIDSLRAANPVDANSPVQRPSLDSIVPGIGDIPPGSVRVQRASLQRSWVGFAVAGGLALGGVAALMLSQVLTPPPPMVDSAFYATFEQLESASAMIVGGTVITEERTEFNGNDVVAYTVDVRASTSGDPSHVEVLIPAVQEGLVGTAETQGLEVGREYVLALSELDDWWQLTSPAGQSAFVVDDGIVARSLDGTLEISTEVLDRLGLSDERVG